MEILQKLLTAYNREFIPNESRRSWSEQFCDPTFSKYWYEVFKVAKNLDRNLRVLEIGCGQGDVTSIFCYLGFKSICSFERDDTMNQVAINKLENLFNRTDIIKKESFPTLEWYDSDILVLVNCVYSDGATNKEEYINHILLMYNMAGKPEIFILEVIDPSYNVPDKNFPYHVRLSEEEVRAMFPQAEIDSIETYRFPQNKRTKRIYIIREIK